MISEKTSLYRQKPTCLLQNVPVFNDMTQQILLLYYGIVISILKFRKRLNLMATVLTIEDNRSISMVINLALSQEGHNVIVFNDCFKAYKNLEEGIKPDIILVDLKMPGMNGKELVEKIRANPELKLIPVTIITGSIPSEDILPPKGSYQALMQKPFDLQDLINTVDSLVA
jgi:CheY-like chemotaxis protein